MKTRSVRSRTRLLGFVLALGLAIAAMASPASAVGDWSGCGDPYIKTIQHCVGIDWIFTFCWNEEQGCADCDQGTACYSF